MSAVFVCYNGMAYKTLTALADVIICSQMLSDVIRGYQMLSDVNRCYQPGLAVG